MAVTNQPIYPQVVNPTFKKLQNSDSTNKVLLYSGGTNGTKIQNIIVSSTETANAKSLAFYVTVSSVDYLLWTINIPLNSGFTTSVAPVFIFSDSKLTNLSIDNHGNRYFYLKSGCDLKAAVLSSAVASGKELSIYLEAGDY